MTSLRVHKNDIELKCSFERKFVFIIIPEMKELCHAKEEKKQSFNLSILWFKDND